MKLILLVFLFSVIGCSATESKQELGPVIILQSDSQTASLALSSTGDGQVLPCKKLQGDTIPPTTVFSCLRPAMVGSGIGGTVLGVLGSILSLVVKTLI